MKLKRQTRLAADNAGGHELPPEVVKMGSEDNQEGEPDLDAEAADPGEAIADRGFQRFIRPENKEGEEAEEDHEDELEEKGAFKGGSVRGANDADGVLQQINKAFQDEEEDNRVLVPAQGQDAVKGDSVARQDADGS